MLAPASSLRPSVFGHETQLLLAAIRLDLCIRINLLVTARHARRIRLSSDQANQFSFDAGDEISGKETLRTRS